MKRRIAIMLCYAVSLSLGLSASSTSNKQAGPTTSPAPSPSPANEVHFAFGGDAAEIPAEFIGNIPFLPLRVDESHPSFFLLDSTVSAFSIDPDRAIALGIAAMQPAVLNL